MKFPGDAPVTSKKLNELRQRIEHCGLKLELVDVKYIRASGPGGQKVNKTSSGVYLSYQPLQLQVKCTKERSRALNRFLALRLLVDKIEAHRNPQKSKQFQQDEKIRKQKQRRKRRSSSSLKESSDETTDASKY